MCGIAAQYGHVDAEAGSRMLERLAHRGPDDDGCVPGRPAPRGPDAEGWVPVGRAWLGHRRLSIVDVEGGPQPLAGPNDRLKLVGNGEVYNHEAIRRKLGQVHFRTSSDNEVALHLVDREGPQCLAEMNGMFAFVIAGDDGSFLAARDPVGIKPLYWATTDAGVAFASEMAAFDPELRAHIEAFPPGYYWMPEKGLVRFASAVPDDARENWRVNHSPGDPLPARALLEVRAMLADAVERQMMGDVPVGVFLSG